MNYKVVVHESEEGFSVSCPGLPGCWSQGGTEAEALENIQSAVREYLAALAGPECEQVKQDPGWIYEAPNRFFAVEPFQGQCPAGSIPVRRLYNNGYATNDSNHRFTVKQSIYDLMLAQGWRGEGVVMCAPQ